MLNRGRFSRRTSAVGALAVAALTVAVTLVAPATPASASGVVCLVEDPASGRCLLEASWQQSGSGVVTVSTTSQGGGVLTTCTRSRLTVADAAEGPAEVNCRDGYRGWYSQTYDCYFDHDAAEDIEEGDVDVIYAGGTAAGDDGVLYLAHCFLEHYTMGGGWFSFSYYFFPGEPDGYGGTPDPTLGLIVDAINELGLQGPEIGTAPPNTGQGLVGLPVWFWTEVTGQTWGNPSAQAAAGPVVVTAEAVSTQIEWHPGDGGEPEVCDQGAAWESGMDPLAPPCGYTYVQPSRELPGSMYSIVGVTHWEVTWSVSGGPSDGLSGTVSLTPQSETALRINEMQVLITYD